MRRKRRNGARIIAYWLLALALLLTGCSKAVTADGVETVEFEAAFAEVMVIDFTPEPAVVVLSVAHSPSPAPLYTPVPTPSPAPTPEPTPELTPEPTPELTPEPTPSPAKKTAPKATSDPGKTATPRPTQSANTPTPKPTSTQPSATQTPAPTPTPLFAPADTPVPTGAPAATPTMPPSSSGSYPQDELVLAAKVAYMEARGNGEDAYRAVLNVILNRCESSKFGGGQTSISTEVYRKSQFSVVRYESFATLTPPSEIVGYADDIFNGNNRCLPDGVIFFRSDSLGTSWGSKVYYQSIGGNAFFYAG